MKKILILLVISVLFIGGCSMVNKSGPTKEEIIEILKSKEVADAIEEAMNNRDSNALTNEGIIKSYDILYESAKWESRGAIEVKIKVNGIDKLYFIYTIRKYNGNYEVTSSTNSKELEQLLKKE